MSDDSGAYMIKESLFGLVLLFFFFFFFPASLISSSACWLIFFSLSLSPADMKDCVRIDSNSYAHTESEPS